MSSVHEYTHNLSTHKTDLHHESLNLEFISDDFTSDEDSANNNSISSINSRNLPLSRNSNDSLTSNSSYSSSSSNSSSNSILSSPSKHNSDTSDDGTTQCFQEDDDFEERFERGRSRSRSVHQYDPNFSQYCPQSEDIPPIPTPPAPQINNTPPIPDKTTSFLQPREINALQKGLEEATQSVNKYHVREDEEERMAADAEKRKRIVTNQLSPSNSLGTTSNNNTINQISPSVTSSSDATRRIKILLLGDSGVGKSSLIVRWTIDTFSPNLHTTVGVNFKSKKLAYKNEILQVQVWDTAGQEQFHKITTSYYRGAQGIMLVYDVTDKKSLDNIEYWIKNIKTHASDNVHVVLVGNKNDLKNTSSNTVDNNHVKEIATKFSVPFFETSAKDNNHVEEAFMSLITQIVESTPSPASVPSTSNSTASTSPNPNIISYSGGLDRKTSNNLFEATKERNQETQDKGKKDKEKSKNKDKEKLKNKDKDCVIC